MWPHGNTVPFEAVQRYLIPNSANCVRSCVPYLCNYEFHSFIVCTANCLAKIQVCVYVFCLLADHCTPESLRCLQHTLGSPSAVCQQAGSRGPVRGRTVSRVFTWRSCLCCCPFGAHVGLCDHVCVPRSLALGARPHRPTSSLRSALTSCRDSCCVFLSRFY